MNLKTLFLSLCLIVATSATAQVQFDTYFFSKTMRMDYFRCGDSKTESIYLDEILEEPYWAGSKTNLIDTAGYGNYTVKVFDAKGGELIYSSNYNNLFGEWQTTAEAKQTQKCYTEAVLFPYPKQDVKVVLESRNRKGVFEKRFEYLVDVDSYLIKKERLNVQTMDIVYSANPTHAVDIVLLSEGYAADQYDQFAADCEKFADAIFSFSPYKEHKNRFNVKAVWCPAETAGVDIPGDNVWNRTALNSTFYTFDSERYIMTNDYKTVRTMASAVPYDLIYIIANTKKYGGGAIYNYYGISSTGQEDSYAKVYVHEFGHLFLGLADEYEGDTSYDEFYPKGVEPWEPNITNLVDFDKKWKHLLPKGTPIPTPKTEKNANSIGVFEGAGYSSKGMYRSNQKCLMRSFGGVEHFCPVCTDAIIKQIDRYTR